MVLLIWFIKFLNNIYSFNVSIILENGNIPEKSSKMSEDQDESVLTDKGSSQHSTKSTVPKSIQSGSIPEENNIATTASGGSIDEILSRKTSNEPESSSALSSRYES